MLTITLLLALLPASFADSTNAMYAARDAESLIEHCGHSAMRQERLLCLYRLYPLTGDANYLADLPSELNAPTARELALLSGLWGYRAAQASLPGMMRDGLRAENLLKQARALDAFDPYVLLVEGQSLLFKPAFVGGDRRAALERFRRLRQVVASSDAPPIAAIEADVWIWFALERIGDADADTMRRDLLAADPPPLYRDFLLDPP